MSSYLFSKNTHASFILMKKRLIGMMMLPGIATFADVKIYRDVDTIISLPQHQEEFSILMI